MKTLALTLMLASCSPVPLYAIEMQGDKVTLSDEDKETLTVCKEQGGCHVWTDVEIKLLIAEVAKRAMAQVSCTRRSI
jgi:hypothetical protein